MSDLLNRIKQWASDRYDSGGDVIVECFTDEEITESLASLEDAKRFCKLRKEKQDDIDATAF